MKKLLFAAGFLCFGLSSAFAQDVKTTAPEQQVRLGSTTASRLDPKRMAAMRANKLEQELALTPEQKTQVETIFTQAAESKGDRMTVENETMQKVKAILTPEQNKKYDDMIAKREEMRKKQLESSAKPQ